MRGGFDSLRFLPPGNAQHFRQKLKKQSVEFFQQTACGVTELSLFFCTMVAEEPKEVIFMEILKVENLTKIYGAGNNEVRALDGVFRRDRGKHLLCQRY